MSLAWKIGQARPLAKKAAEDLASELNKKGGAIKDETVKGYRVVSIPPIARRHTSFLPGQLGAESSEESPIPDVPYAGEAFRKAYFDLQPGSAAVAPNEPKTVYYVMAFENREPATFAKLYAPNGDEFRYKMMARDQAARAARRTVDGLAAATGRNHVRLGASRRSEGQSDFGRDVGPIVGPYRIEFPSRTRHTQAIGQVMTRITAAR